MYSLVAYAETAFQSIWYVFKSIQGSDKVFEIQIQILPVSNIQNTNTHVFDPMPDIHIHFQEQGDKTTNINRYLNNTQYNKQMIVYSYETQK